MNIIRHLIFAVVCLIPFVAPAEGRDATADILQDHQRTFDKVRLNELKADPTLNYGSGPAALSLWERFKIWLNSLFDKFLDFTGSVEWMDVLFTILAIVLLTYVILRLLKIDAFKIFYSGSDKGKVAPVLFTENIHEMDFDKLLNEALQRGDFRIATRLVFLRALRLLSEKHYVEWHPGKTNRDYVGELKGSSLQSGFEELNRFFEYAWYGNFTITSTLFDRINSRFNEWKGNVS